MRMRTLAVMIMMATWSTGSAGAATVNLGFLSFDVLIPSDTGPGVNVFNISNFTGDPLLGGFALPPDFPALDSLTFLNSSLTLSDGGPPQVIALGDMGPGSLSPTSPVEFPDTAQFTSAIFTATLSQTTFLLDGGGSFTAATSIITASLLPSSGQYLVAGFDFAIVTVSDSPEVPEPGSVLLVAAGAVALWRRHLWEVRR